MDNASDTSDFENVAADTMVERVIHYMSVVSHDFQLYTSNLLNLFMNLFRWYQGGLCTVTNLQQATAFHWVSTLWMHTHVTTKVSSQGAPEESSLWGWSKWKQKEFFVKCQHQHSGQTKSCWLTVKKYTRMLLVCILVIWIWPFLSAHCMSCRIDAKICPFAQWPNLSHGRRGKRRQHIPHNVKGNQTYHPRTEGIT